MKRRNPYLRSSVVAAIFVNILALALLFLGLELRRSHDIQPPPTVEPAKASLVDAAVLREAEERKRREAQAARQAELERERRAAEEARRRAEAERKRKAAEEARRRAEAERLQRLREQEEAALRARQLAGLQDRYVAEIRTHVERAWRRPPGVQSASRCTVEVHQTPEGRVTQVRTLACTGDAAFRRSVEDAVWRADPLPEAPDPAVFDRIIQFEFEPR